MQTPCKIIKLNFLSPFHAHAQSIFSPCAARAAANARWLGRLMGCAGEEAAGAKPNASAGGSNPLHAVPPAEQGAGATPAQDSSSASASTARWRQLDAAQYEELLMGELAAANELHIASLEAEVAALRRGADKGGADAEGSSTITSNSSRKMEGGVGLSVGGTRLLALSRLTLSVSPGELVAIVGPVGSGKSSLLLSLLGELRVLFGSVACKGKLAIVGQRPFIFNSTVKDNILNLLPLDEARYAEACAACALVPDFAVLPAGDLTEIGGAFLPPCPSKFPLSLMPFRFVSIFSPFPHIYFSSPSSSSSYF